MPRLWSRARVSLLASVFCASYAAAEAQTVTLTITNNGIVTGAVGVQGTNGNVCNPNPGGGSTGGTCVFTYPVNTPLRIAANSPNPDPGFLHSGSGDAAGCALSTCNIVLTKDSAITATFNRAQGPVGSITTTLLGDGKGTVYFDNGTCQNFELGYTACTTYYAAGSEAKFQGQSMPGNIFAAFSGGTGGASGCAGSSPCTFTVSAGTSAVSATFSAMVSAAITPGAATIGVGQNQNFSALATFTNGMTRYGFTGHTSWQSHTSTDVKRLSLAAAVVSDRLYAVGGVAGTCASSPCAFAPLGTVEMFNPLITTAAQGPAWTPRASMITPREGLAATVVNGKIYALGGHTTGGGAVASMEFYDPTANTWSARAPMPGPRAGMAAAVIGTTIYVVGGDSSASGETSIPLATVAAYDANTNSWITKAPMLTARRAPAAAAVNGTLFVIGGDGSGSVEAYDPASDTWTVKATMPGGGAHVAATLNGLIYAVGDSPGSVKVYNPARDSWAVLGSLPSPQRSQFALAVLDGRLFATGGMLADQTAVGTLSANRPPETTWWSQNTVVGQINSGNDGRVNGLAVGTAAISARLVAIDSASPGATLTVAVPVTPTITGSPAALRFSATKGSPGAALVSVTSAQTVAVTYTGATAPAWTASSNQPWLQITSGTGTGTGSFTATVSDPANTIAGSTNLTATITLSAPNVNLTKTVAVTLSVKLTTATDAPFGSFDTPIDGATGVSGSIAVSGWAMDDVEVTRVEIWRDRVAGETTPVYAGAGLGNGKIYVADPVFVTGARPDIEAGYGTLPLANRAGWGYLLLTQGLWQQGNGTFTLYAFAYDRDGRSASLGSKTIAVSNSTATKPFGSIDTPSYGQTVTSSLWNFGWALTPNAAPTCTITNGNVLVSIDSGPLIPVSYGDARPDIAGAFPGFSNGAGAGGAYYIDTSTLANGNHQIGWYVVDNCNRAEGIGSRFFSVLNTSSTVPLAARPTTMAADAERQIVDVPVIVRRDLEVVPVEATADGEHLVTIRQDERTEVELPATGGAPYVGYQIVNGTRRALPEGASLDGAAGVFYWQPAPGFLGTFDLEFVAASGGVVRVRTVVAPPGQ